VVEEPLKLASALLVLKRKAVLLYPISSWGKENNLLCHLSGPSSMLLAQLFSLV